MSLRLVAIVCFWLSVGALFYTYIGYPLLVALMSLLRPRHVSRAESMIPTVTVIITAYNEERDLAAKILNTLALDYPKEKLEILIASDCSSDRTDEIARSFADKGVSSAPSARKAWQNRGSKRRR